MTPPKNKRDGMRRDNAFANLPDKIRARVDEMLLQKDPYLTYPKIHHETKLLVRQWNRRHPDKKLKAPSQKALGVYYRKHVAQLAEEEADRLKMVKDLKAQLIAAAEVSGADEAIDNLLEVIILRNQPAIERMKPAELLSLQMRGRKIALKDRELEVNRERLQMENDRLRLQVDKWKAVAKGEQSVELPADDDVFNHVSRTCLQILMTFKDLRPALEKYRRNIAKRLATEAERFELSEVANG